MKHTSSFIDSFFHWELFCKITSNEIFWGDLLLPAITTGLGSCWHTCSRLCFILYYQLYIKGQILQGQRVTQNLVLLSASLTVVQQCMEIPREVVKNGTTLNQQNSRDGSQNHVGTQAEMAQQKELSILNIDPHIAEVNIFYIGYRLGMWVRKPHHHRNIILPTDHLDSKSIPPNNGTPYEPIIKTHESMASISIQTTTNRN